MRDRILELLRKEFIQMMRDVRIRAIMVGFPVIQILIFGYVVNTDVNHIEFAVLDQDKSPQSRELISRFAASKYFTLTSSVEDVDHLEELLLTQDVAMTLQIPPRFSAYLESSQSSPIQIVVDGSVSNISSVVVSYATSLVEEYSRQQSLKRLKRLLAARPQTMGRKYPRGNPGIDLRLRAWYNPDLESRNFYLPGVVAFLVMLICLLLTSMAVVKEKEIGTMEQLVVTPIRPFEMIAGKTLPFALVGLFDMGLVVAVAFFWFHIPIRGSLWLLFLGALLFIACALGIGLFISTISATMQQAMMTTFFVLNPLFLLSGFAFPVEDMPVPIQYLTYLNPLRYFLVIVRGIFLKGTGLELLWPQYAALLGIGITILTASATRFHKRME